MGGLTKQEQYLVGLAERSTDQLRDSLREREELPGGHGIGLITIGDDLRNGLLLISDPISKSPFGYSHNVGFWCGVPTVLFRGMSTQEYRLWTDIGW